MQRKRGRGAGGPVASRTLGPDRRHLRGEDLDVYERQLEATVARRRRRRFSGLVAARDGRRASVAFVALRARRHRLCRLHSGARIGRKLVTCARTNP